MRTAIALLTKDHVELTRRSIKPLLQPDKFDLYVIDGSTTSEGREYHGRIESALRWQGIGGGPDAAIVFALSNILGADYDYLGICEQDVLLDPDWFGPTMALFERGKKEGLKVGAVSARSYEDRILVQRDGYAVMHNLGAGHVVFSHEAARTLLNFYRTGHTMENRLAFSYLSGKDPAAWNSFLAMDTYTTADWQFDVILARNGYSSLALVPSLATMLDQDIESMGLRYAQSSVELLRDTEIRKIHSDAGLLLPRSPFLVGQSGSLTVFPHQLASLAGVYSPEWRLKWSQAFGPFAYRAREGASLSFFAQGQVGILAADGTCEVRDTQSGYLLAPEITPKLGIAKLAVPGTTAYRRIKVKALTPFTFHGVEIPHSCPWRYPPPFTWDVLPEVEG